MAKSQESQEFKAALHKAAQARYLQLLDTRRQFSQEVLAKKAYQDALAYARVHEEVESLGVEAITQFAAAASDPRFDDAFAPNLPPNHPVNLRSRKFGNEETLRELEALNDLRDSEKETDRNTYHAKVQARMNRPAEIN